MKPTATPMAPKMEPRVHISYDKEGMMLKGDLSAIELGKTVTVEITGEVTGFSMQDYGCTIDLKPKSLKVEAGPDPDQDKTEKSRTVILVQNLKTKHPKSKEY